MEDKRHNPYCKTMIMDRIDVAKWLRYVELGLNSIYRINVNIYLIETVFKA